MKITRIAAVGLVAASLSIAGLAGCGSSDSSASSSAADTTAATAAMTKAELVAAATEVCNTVNADVKALQDKADATTVEGIQSFVADAQAASEKALADLQALTPPDEVATEYQAYLDAQAAAVAGSAKVADTVAGASDAKAVQAAVEEATTEMDALTAEAKSAAKAAGLPACAKESNDS